MTQAFPLPSGVPRRGATSEAVFFERRAFLKTAACALVGPAACGQEPGGGRPAADDAAKLAPPFGWPEGFAATRAERPGLPAGIDHRLTPRETAAEHNNFYEFLFGRGGPVWRHVGGFVVEPWSVEVTGACRKPATFGLDDLLRLPHEERLYHFRCVERWAMNVPWTGFPLRALLERVEPADEARFVRFVSAHRPEQMPGVRSPGAAGHVWPYHEALRLDEAMNELTLVATGVYGRPLLKQHGAPVRIVVPWKYGYKSPKSIVRIELAAEQPPTFWSRGGYGHEYGFLSNVNPNIPHPRWSQASSYWLDTRESFATPLFNGYAEHVAGLYPDEPATLQPPLRPGQTAR